MAPVTESVYKISMLPVGYAPAHACTHACTHASTRLFVHVGSTLAQIHYTYAYLLLDDFRTSIKTYGRHS